MKISNYLIKQAGNYNYLIFRGKIISKFDISALSRELLSIKERFKLLAIQFVDAMDVWNLRHIESAIWHTMNASANERLISRTLSLEVLLYLAGERQINKALKNLGLKDTSKEVLVILISTTVDSLKETIVYLPQVFPLEIEETTFVDLETKFDYFIEKVEREGLHLRELNSETIENYLLQKTALLALE